jgi:hypothetical protein
LLLATLASTPPTVFSWDGLSLSYGLESPGVQDIETQPGSAQSLTLYHLYAWLANGGANTLAIRGAMDVSFFSESNARIEVGRTSTERIHGAECEGLNIEMNARMLAEKCHRRSWSCLSG